MQKNSIDKRSKIMKMTTRSITMALIISAVGFAGTICPAAEVPSRGPISFGVYDADGNGSISEREFNAVKEQRQSERTAEGRPGFGMAESPTFPQVDTNGDGHITKEELNAAQQAQWGKKGMGQGGGRGQGRQ
jgi:hypothetical protein